MSRTAPVAIAVTAALLAVGVAATGLPAPAGAAGDPPPTTGGGSEPGFELVAMDRAWMAPGETAVLELAVDDDTGAAVEIAVIAHQAIDSFTSFERTLTGAGLGSTVPGGAIGFPLAELPRGAAGTRVLELGLQDPALPDPNRLPLDRTNVYPLEFELRDDDGNVLAEFVMPLVVAAPNPDGSPIMGEKLRVAWVWPLVAPPARRPFGEPEPDVVEQLAPEGRLGRQATALAAAPDLSFTVAPGPETLEAWTEMAVDDAELAGGLDAMETVLRTNQVLAGPYVPVNVPSLVAGGLESQVGAELAHGTDTLSTFLGTRVDPRTLLVDPLDAAALVNLRGANVDRVIVDGDAVVPIDSQFTPARPFDLTSQGRTVEAVATDRGVSAPLTSEDDSPALRAQQFLAALSVVALEQPNAARGVAIANPASWDPPAELLEPAVAGLRGHPLLVPVAVDQLFAQVPTARDDDDERLQRQLEPYLPPPPPIPVAEHERARAELDSLRSLIGGDDPRIAQGDRALLVSLSSAYERPGGRERARAALGVIGFTTNDLLSQIRVPVGSTITLTARRGEIPVTFLNETDLTLRVRVRLESDRLFFPDGAERELVLAPRNTTVRFTVESRGSGTFPLQLTVTSMDEGLVIQSTRVRVRSTFVSGVGVFITVGAAVFLAGWWLLHFRRRRPRTERGPTGNVR